MNDAAASRLALSGRQSDTARPSPIRLCCACASAISPRHGCAMTTFRSTSCCAGRAGWSITSGFTATTRKDGLSLRLKRPRRHVSAANRERQPAATTPNELWSMDIVSDALFDGRQLRALTIVDTFTCEALAIEVDQGIKGEQVAAAVA